MKHFLHRLSTPWKIQQYLTTISHTPILQGSRRMYMDKRSYEAGLVGRVT